MFPYGGNESLLWGTVFSSLSLSLSLLGVNSFMNRMVTSFADLSLCMYLYI